MKRKFWTGDFGAQDHKSSEISNHFFLFDSPRLFDNFLITCIARDLTFPTHLKYLISNILS